MARRARPASTARGRAAPPRTRLHARSDTEPLSRSRTRPSSWSSVSTRSSRAARFAPHDPATAASAPAWPRRARARRRRECPPRSPPDTATRRPSIARHRFGPPPAIHEHWRKGSRLWRSARGSQRRQISSRRRRATPLEHQAPERDQGMSRQPDERTAPEQCTGDIAQQPFCGRVPSRLTQVDPPCSPRRRVARRLPEGPSQRGSR